jgi:hypothetical protein
MQPRDLAAYGGAYSDARPQSDPLTQVASDSINLLMEDTAQLTRVPIRVMAMFTTNNVTDPAVIDYGRTQWGTGVSYKPTVTRTGVGLFTVTFSATYTDGLDETESLALVDADAKQEFLAAGFTARLCYARAASNIIYVGLHSVAGALVDTTGDRITVWGW